jgi:hypothetical protein
VLPGSGLGTTFQAEPSQCSIRVWIAALLLLSNPTAQALQTESAITPSSTLSEVPGLGGARQSSSGRTKRRLRPPLTR